MFLLIGNALAFLGCILMVLTGVIKKKENVLYVQCVQFSLMGGGNFVLGAYSGVVANVLSIVRNLIFAKTGGTTWLKIVFIVIQVALTLITGDGSWLVWLPVIATVIFTWALDTKNIVIFKLANAIGQVMWMIYDLNYQNYAGFAFDIMAILSTLWGIYLVRKQTE